MVRLNENLLIHTDLVGLNCKNVEGKMKSLVDNTFTNNCDTEMFDFFDIRGTVLLHGIPGCGKTSIANNVMLHALEKYGIESYVIRPSEIICSGLGDSVKNMAEELEEFEKKDEGILFIDEIDKFCVNRDSQDELSEMKRLLIEMMGFIDRLSINSKKIVIGCTNVYDNMDSAMKRRFAICEEIGKPSNEERLEFVKVCLKKTKLDGMINAEDISENFLSKHETMDSIKSYFRDKVIENNLDSVIIEIKNK